MEWANKKQVDFFSKISPIFLREKYERKIEKLMLFIFSIMHYSGNQLGSGPDKKSLTNEGNFLFGWGALIKNQ